MLAEWTLALSALGTVLAVAGMARLVMRDLIEHIDRRFGEADARRQEAGNVWAERLAVRDAAIARLTSELVESKGEHGGLHQRIDAIRAELADGYVSRETWLEHVGSINIKLDKLKTELDRLADRLER
jgi:chromosome segregation ATPase